MSTTPRPPLLSDADLNEKFRVKHNEKYDGYAHGTAGFNTAAYVRDRYETARAKDAELIQMAYNALLAITDESCGHLERLGIAHSALDVLTAAGFKPSDE